MGLACDRLIGIMPDSLLLGKGTSLNNPTVKYLIFDIESVADGALVSKIRYPGEKFSPEEAIANYRQVLLDQFGSDFIPYTFQFPVSVVVAKVNEDFELMDLVALDDPEFRPNVITENFWRGWQAYHFPTFVTFNGRTFDMPLMELAAFRFGLPIGQWFNFSARSYDQPRNRYNTSAHLDLHDVLTNFGASRFNGGLNLAASLLGKPGKMDVQGDMVQDMYLQGQAAAINDYCRCDVLDTYFVFLRTMVLLGELTLDREKEVVDTTKLWLESRVEEQPVYAAYLERWGDWANPWRGAPSGVASD